VSDEAEELGFRGHCASVQNPQHYRACTELLFSLITSRCVTDRNANNRSLPRIKGSETSGLFEERKTLNVENRERRNSSECSKSPHLNEQVAKEKN
jgi:hypothetical protein